jgi:hypothetical protein
MIDVRNNAEVANPMLVLYRHAFPAYSSLYFVCARALPAVYQQEAGSAKASPLLTGA